MNYTRAFINRYNRNNIKKKDLELLSIFTSLISVCDEICNKIS